VTTKVYNKLVRDRIPEIIQAEGKTYRTENISGPDLLVALKKKLVEEVAEFEEDNDVKELADILEVVYALSEVLGCEEGKLNALRKSKTESNGGFEKGIFLLEAEI